MDVGKKRAYRKKIKKGERRRYRIRRRGIVDDAKTREEKVRRKGVDDNGERKME